LFYTNYSIELQLYRKPKEFGSIAEYTRIDIEQIKNLYNSLVINIKFFAERIAFYTNKKCLKGPWLKKGDKVYPGGLSDYCPSTSLTWAEQQLDK
jgi:hypothetical protein